MRLLLTIHDGSTKDKLRLKVLQYDIFFAWNLQAALGFGPLGKLTRIGVIVLSMQILIKYVIEIFVMSTHLHMMYIRYICIYVRITYMNVKPHYKALIP